jgi:hypothetical protein
MKKWLIPSIGAVIGGLLGYLYWKNVGCESGTCAITSSPVNSSLYGMLMGGLLFSSIEDFRKNKQKES